MLNDRDDKYEGQEESEYHFSDDDVSYEEVEPEAAAPKATPRVETKENFIARLSRSKRMLISAIVFVILVFVVYKMIAPSSTSTDANNPTITAEKNNAEPTTPTTVVQRSPAPVAQPVQPQTMAQTQPVAQMPANMTAQQPVMQAMPTQQQQAMTQPQMVQQPQQQQPQMNPPQAMVQPQPMMQPQMQQQPQMMQPAQTMQPQMQQPMPNQQVAPQPQAMQAMTTTQGMTTSDMMNTQTQQGAVQPVTTNTAMTVGTQQLMSQLNDEYQQKVNNYAAQNKALEDQMRTLTQRVATMELQLNQLVQAMTHSATPNTQQQTQQPAASSTATPADDQVPFTVQAIIPGRAWLRADSGETITAAEGDVIRDLGRVTKIDPYNGVVEINTGTKVISLSYGNGGGN